MVSQDNTQALLPFPEFCILPEAPGLLGCSLDKIVQMAAHNEIEICVWFKAEKEVSLILKRDSKSQTAMFLDFILENKVQISERCTFECLAYPEFSHLRHTSIKKIPERFEEPEPESNTPEFVKRSKHIKYRANTAFIPAVVTGLWKIENPPINLAMTRQIFIQERHFYITPSDYNANYPEILFRPRSHTEKLLFTLEDIYITKNQLERARYLLEHEKYSKESDSKSYNRQRYAPDREQILLGILHLLLKRRDEFEKYCIDENGEVNEEELLKLIRRKAKLIFRNNALPLGDRTVSDLLSDAFRPPKERKMAQNKPGSSTNASPPK